MDTMGNHLVDWEKLKQDDIVIIPAFGTTLEIQKRLNQIGINPYSYNTTCPFVEKVWNRSNQIGNEGYTIIIHGKNYHEETRATFSHAIIKAPSLIVRDLKETEFLAAVISGETSAEEFYSFFKGKFSEGFDVEKDLAKIGVVNQTTMLASETEAIAECLKKVMIKKYGLQNINRHFADTRDTLCYATYDNQESTIGVLKEKADLAIVIGGYNSSNTSHIAELCEEKLPTYFISSADKILDKNLISHFDLRSKTEIVTRNFLPDVKPVNIIITSGASCPDAIVDRVLQKILSFYPQAKNIDEVMQEFVD
jgi:4-hydroxy-3-methylbut-2-enyl diphosphate reductase